MRQDVSRLPELVIVGVSGELVPKGDLAVEVVLVGIAERSEIEEELIAVGSAEVEAFGPLGHQPVTGLAEGREKAEAHGQGEGSVVVHVVEEPVGDRRLRRGSLERRVRVDHPCGGVETGVGDAPKADPAVVVRQVLDEPVDGVEGVGALVGVLGPVLRGDMRSHVDELALGHEPTADILENKDVSVALEFAAGSELGLVLVGAVGPHRVRGSDKQDRIRHGGVIGRIDRGKERDPIAHGDPVFELGEMGADELLALGVLGVSLGRCHAGQTDD